MSAVIPNHVATPATRAAVPAAPSFNAWLQGLSSGLRLAGNLNQALEDILRSPPFPTFDMLPARAEMRAAERRIQELEAELARMRELACEDHLTGCLNRRGLTSALERELARAARSGAPLCVALLDLDDFKKLNDTHGHCGGDAALAHLVQVMNSTLRKTDVIGRFGGEEFMVVLPDTPLEDAIRTMNRVRAELHRHGFVYEDKPVPLTFSAGVTACRAGDDHLTPVARADEALYCAKRAGKDRVASAG